jgi:1-acyl-sn-glycerol-3-phosphate acyltransferase
MLRLTGPAIRDGPAGGQPREAAMLPPRLVRRVVLAPLVVVLAVALAILFPLIVLVSLAFRAVRRPGPGGMRVSRLLSFALAWCTAETAALFVCLGLWVASGFGGRLNSEPYQARHYAVMRSFLGRLYRAATRTCRHAGPGDSFLLVHQLLNVYERRPRVVMKAALQFDPSLDVMGNRLPNVFVSRRRAGERVFTEQIDRLARGLDRRGALVIFPEGGNWTPGRWHRGIRRLEQRGRRDLASRARSMPNLLPPRPGGALAAIAACPDADVIFVAHAGLDRLVSVADIWRSLPMDQVVVAKWWRVPVGKVPRDAPHESQVRWLYDWWQLIDAWVTANRPEDATAPALSSGPPAD